MKTRRVRVILLALLLIVVLSVLALTLPFQITPAGRDRWLEAHRAAQLSSGSGEAQLTDTYAEGSLEVQLWQVSAEGRQYYDAVVWQRNLLGRYRVLHTEWLPVEEASDWWMSFGFHSGFYWYHFDVSLTEPKLLAPDKSFRLR